MEQMQTYKTLNTEGIAYNKPDAYHSLFQHELINVKEEHGHGVYSYAEGMTRKAARKIARNRARKRLREIMADLDEQNYKLQNGIPEENYKDKVMKEIQQGALNNGAITSEEVRSSQATA